MAQGTDWAVAVTQAFFVRGSIPAARRSCLASLVDAHLSFDVESVAKYGCNQSFIVGQRGYGATVARLTPDQKVGSSNLSAVIFIFACRWARLVSTNAPCRLLRIENPFPWRNYNAHRNIGIVNLL